MDLLDALRTLPWFFIGTVLIVGTMVGSFLNVVIHRLPKMMENDWRQQCIEFLHPEEAEKAAANPPPRYSLAVPRSACPVCGHNITPIENVPILSYVFLLGKCRACKTPISIRYPIVEALTGIASAFAAWHFGFGWAAAFAIIFIWALIALTFIDADTTLLPDDITLPLLWLGLLLNLGHVFTDIQSALVGAAAGYLILWLVYWGFKLLTGKDGMGYGDFKLLAAIGAWLGWQLLPLVILLSAVLGTVIGIAGIVLHGKEKGAKLPFGPYLAVAGFIAMFWGRQITQWYLGQMPS